MRLCYDVSEMGASALERGLPRWTWAPVALLVSGILAFAILRPVQVLPRLALAPGLALIDQAGVRFTSEDLRGKIVLYNFTYTRCAASCPPMSETMQALQTRLGEIDAGNIPIVLVTISFDPAHDTPERLKAYAAQVGANPERWRIATGDEARLKYALGGGFNLYYAPNPDGTFTFDPLFALVDGWGIIRAFYKTATPAPERLLRDLRLVVQEARHSTGVARLAYEAAHLFLCYPP